MLLRPLQPPLLAEHAQPQRVLVARRHLAGPQQAARAARVRLQAEWGELKARSMTPERKAALDREHRAIVDAIRRRDRADTRARLREHIRHVRCYMLGE